MDILALFSNKTAEEIIISSIPHKKDESGLLFRSTISRIELRESVHRSITNTYNYLLTKFPDYSLILEPISICILGFSGSTVIGESAELAFSLAFINYLVKNGIINAGKKLPQNVAATGTINDRFDVGAVSSLKEKILAAIDQNADLVIYPYANSGDVEHLFKEDIDICSLNVSSKMIPVKTLEDVFLMFGLEEVKKDGLAEEYKDNNCHMEAQPEDKNNGKPVSEETKVSLHLKIKRTLIFTTPIIVIAITVCMLIFLKDGHISSRLLGALHNTSKPFSTSAAAATGPTISGSSQSASPDTTLISTQIQNTPVLAPVKGTPVKDTPAKGTPAASTSTPGAFNNRFLIFDDGNIKDFSIVQNGGSTLEIYGNKNGYSGKAAEFKYNLIEGGAVSAVYKLQSRKIDRKLILNNQKVSFYYQGYNKNAANSLELKLSCFNSSKSYYYTLNNSTQVDSKFERAWIPVIIDFDDFNPHLGKNDIFSLGKIEISILNDPRYGDKSGEGAISICDFQIS